MKKLLVYALMGFLFAIVQNSCKKDDVTPETADFSSEVATEWMDLLLKLTKEGTGFTPPVAARAFGYTGLTLYESVRYGMPGYKSMAGQVNGFSAAMLPEKDDEEYHWGAVANSATATIIKACYSNASVDNLTAIENLENLFNTHHFASEATQEVLDRSIAFGKEVGAAMVAYAASDNQVECFKSNFPASYVPPVGDGLWKPTPPAFQAALQPYWGGVRPFLTENVGGVLPTPPPAYSTDPSSKFMLEATEVYNVVKNLTPDQLLIAQYWSDDPGKTATPPGHSISILKQVLEKENANLAEAAEAFAKVGMGVHDAFISCWNAKFTYNYVRPISVILEKIDPAFTVPLTTPPFPEYTSGHSVQSGASAQILTDLFGENYSFTDRTHESRVDINGAPRSYSSFFEFADEAAISRLYGGIHFRAAIEVGVSQGKAIGSNISALNFK